jgi:hypothetical protein
MSDKITIAVALRRIKKLKGHIAEHSARAQQGVSYVSGKAPAFRFQQAMALLDEARGEMLDLESRVAIANAKKMVVEPGGDKITLAFAIRLLQEMKGQIAFFRGLVLRTDTVREREQDWNEEQMKHIVRVNEVVYVSDLSEQDRDACIKELQDAFETLNNVVEEANHTVLV